MSVGISRLLCRRPLTMEQEGESVGLGEGRGGQSALGRPHTMAPALQTGSAAALSLATCWRPRLVSGPLRSAPTQALSLPSLQDTAITTHQQTLGTCCVRTL